MEIKQKDVLRIVLKKGEDVSVIRMRTVAFAGMEALPVEVEVSISSGLPKFVIVGLPDAIVSESRIRISRALASALPAKSITVNLSPADIKKEGSHYDLPIAICLLVALNVLPAYVVERYVAFGELSLDGRVLESRGVLLAAMCANELGLGVICARDSGQQAKIAGGDLKILAPYSLTELVNYFKNEGTISRPDMDLPAIKIVQRNDEDIGDKDFEQVKGQESAKLALQIAASGGHHALLVGPPGCGKSMLSSRFTTILPDLEPSVALEATIIHSLSGRQVKGGALVRPPLREPHHSASMVALIGGGAGALPGEASLAHGGVLFLDEFAEFSSTALQALREAMETGYVNISRAQARSQYPARFQLIAAMNPCKCGMFGERKCLTGPNCSRKYWQKISGPLLDRFDLCVQMHSLKPWELSSIPTSEMKSELIKMKVFEARQLQLRRQGCLNAHLSQKGFEQFVTLEEGLMMFMQGIAKKYEMSGRGITRLMKTARTIADIRFVTDSNSSENIIKNDLLEAASFKLLHEFL